MPDQLLDTKLHVPRLRHRMVVRPRLDERLGRGTRSRVTLISAPAGFGKTTLVAGWLATGEYRPSTAWVSLDAGDNDPTAFWSYVLAAIDTASSGACQGARASLETPGVPIEAVLTRALNDLAAVGSDIVLVLDDYHEVEASEIHRAMTFLLDHLPPRLHLVLTTRADPPLPLARLRARGELVEIRAADLRFTLEEAAAFLAGPMGLTVSSEDVGALERRTEGWIAALQLAGLSMQGRADPGDFISGFAGDDRYIVDYLVEEVLLRQPEPVRHFLLETSILERLTGPLCDAVTGREDGRATLEALDRANLFLIPLDDRRRWYRYHHLFADMLRTHLIDERPEEVSMLHRRAGEWFAQQGDRTAAIHHALAGGDAARAADLIELAVPDMRRTRQELTLRGWLEALPRWVLESRPVLGLAYVGALMQSGQLGGVDELLQSAEQWAEGHPGDTDADGDGAELDRVPVEIAMYRAAQALMSGDATATAMHARRALDLSDAADDLGRGAAATLLGLALWTSGDLAVAERRYEEGMAHLERAGFLSDVLGCSIALADMQIAQGRLEDAQRTYERGMTLAVEREGPLRGAADMHTGLGELARERNDLAEASERLDQSRRLGDELGLPQNAYRWRLLAARCRQTEGDLAGAIELVSEAERWHTTDMSPDVRPLAAVKARLLIARGDLDAAEDWARRQGVAATDDVTYLREFELATLARLLVAHGSRDGAEGPIDDALGLTQRLLVAAEAGQRNGSVLDILVVRALAVHARGDVTGALAELTRTLALAEPHGHVRIVLDEGPPMLDLLRLMARQGLTGSYAGSLLAAARDASRTHGPAPAGGHRQPLVEPLSERELDVLGLLQGDLGGPAIANELVVSVNTVRTHTRNIYAKLGVNDRRAAVRRARELGLLGHARDRGSSA